MKAGVAPAVGRCVQLGEVSWPSATDPCPSWTLSFRRCQWPLPSHHLLPSLGCVDPPSLPADTPFPSLGPPWVGLVQRRPRTSPVPQHRGRSAQRRARALAAGRCAPGARPCKKEEEEEEQREQRPGLWWAVGLSGDKDDDLRSGQQRLRLRIGDLGAIAVQSCCVQAVRRRSIPRSPSQTDWCGCASGPCPAGATPEAPLLQNWRIAIAQKRTCVARWSDDGAGAWWAGG